MQVTTPPDAQQCQPGGLATGPFGNLGGVGVGVVVVSSADIELITMTAAIKGG